MKFVHVPGTLLNIDQISRIDLEHLEDKDGPWIWVSTIDGKRVSVEGSLAIDLLMSIKPSVFEGKRLKWMKRAWAIHNLVGHPLMQLAAFFGKYELAMKIHEATVPKPRGKYAKEA